MRPAYETDFLSNISVEPSCVGVLIGAQFHPDKLDLSRLPFALPGSLGNAILKRQADFVSGRLLAMKAQDGLGRAACLLPIGPRREPIWPEGMSGSISHSAGHAMVWAVESDKTLLGLDIEAPAEGRALEAICHSVLSCEEQSILGGSNRALTAAFSAKETLYKALSPRVGAFFGFDAARVLEASPQTIGLELTRDLSQEFTKGKRFEVCAQDWRGFICTRLKVALQ